MTRTAPFVPGTPWELFRFEALEAGGPPAVAEGVPAEGGGEPVEGGGEAAWGGPSQEEWEHLTRTNQALSQWALQQAQQAASAGEPVRFDPFSEDADTTLRQIIQEAIAPLVQQSEAMGLQAGQDLAYDVIDDYVAREGEFLHEGSKERAFQLARYFMPEAQQRYGNNDRAGEAALEAACKAIREWENQVGEAFHTRKMNELGTLAGARREPGGNTGAGQITAGPYERGQRVTDRFFGR